MHICLVTSKVFVPREGVGDYTLRLGEELAREHRVTLLTGAGMGAAGERNGVTVLPAVPSWGPSGLRVLARTLDKLQPDVLNLQFEPHLYHRWGINLWLPLAMLWLRWRGVRLLTTVHEPFVPLTHWKWWLTGPAQRLALAILICASRKVLVSIESWTRMLQRAFPWRAHDLVWIPVGSAISEHPLSPLEREAVWKRWGVPEDHLLVGCFSPLGSGKRLDLLLETWNLVARRLPNLSLVLIGVTRDEMLGRVASIPLDDRVTCTGYLAPQEVSRLMGCLAVLLAPYVDGVSARRTAAIAAMAHGVPIVATLGHLTDRSLFEGSPIRLVDGDRPDALASAVEDLLSSDREREEVGKRTRWFYEQHFAWAVIAKRVLEVATAA